VRKPSRTARAESAFASWWCGAERTAEGEITGSTVVPSTERLIERPCCDSISGE
jgi:hypothetical protein